MIAVVSQKKEVLLTDEGLANIKDELEQLKTCKRHEVVARLKAAIAQGDLSENSEYDAAKEEQAFIEARIVTVENIIRNAKIINADNFDKNLVHVGSTVTIQEIPEGDLEKYVIVGSPEADPAKGKISNESPVGSALLDKKVGEIADINTPAGTLQFKIVEIN